MGSLSKVQEQIVLGSILGDGYLRKKVNAHLEITHSMKQKEYVDWQYHFLKDIVITPPKFYKGNEGRIGYRFYTKSLPELTFFYNKYVHITILMRRPPRPRAKEDYLLRLILANDFIGDFFDFLLNNSFFHAVILSQIRTQRHDIGILVSGLYQSQAISIARGPLFHFLKVEDVFSEF